METLLAIIVVTGLVALGTWLRRRHVLRIMERDRHGEDYDPERYHSPWKNSVAEPDQED